jgi:NDP-sugar pyrophosphorylase family protein
MATLVILAAGVGSRYGKGIKQLTPIGPQGETLMELSVRDAVAAGFDRFIFIINSSIIAEFYNTVGKRMEAQGIQYEIVFQSIPLYRNKPWGTTQAVMLCRNYIREPFAVINADDYYGAEAMAKAYTFLIDNAGQYGMICYTLSNTLWSSGAVTRGICETDSRGNLVGIRETRNITTEGGTVQKFKGTEIVSVNFLLLPPSFFDMASRNFQQYMWRGFDISKDEWLLPDTIDSMIRNDNVNVKIIQNNSRCIGMTYESDTEAVRKFLRENITPQGV